MSSRTLWSSLFAGLLFTMPAVAADKPLKVYILAGQSNMQGHAAISTFGSMANDPKTAPLLEEMRTADGKPKVCDRVWISSIGCLGDAYSDLKESKGKLTAGFGAPSDKIGPEFTFGLTMAKAYQEPILIIKTSWGGRSLHTDFRPPSAGVEKINDFTIEQWKKRGNDVEKETEKIQQRGGVFYRHMIDHVRLVLKDIKRVVPDYDAKQGYELAGFVWFQGFNDYVDGWTYHNQNKPGGYDLYADLLTHFIRDVRKDLSAPKLPFVIGVMGIGGDKEGKKAPQMHFRDAQRKPAQLDEFKGNVFVVETSPFWDNDLETLQVRMERFNQKMDQEFRKAGNQMTEEMKQAARKRARETQFRTEELKRLKEGVSNGGYHYLGAAKIIAPIGKAFAESLISANAPAKPKENATEKGTGAEKPITSPVPAELAGYLLVPHEKVDASFNAGFSMYVAAWPLLKNYPGSDFQSGLFGTWMFGQFKGPAPKKHYSDIEGGLGWWRDTRFATETPKFIMGGVALEFSEWANGPGAGQGRDWKRPAGKYAVAQLSPWVIWPPDGLNLKQGTSGELFGYGYLPLPLTNPKTTTAGKDVVTGNHCWTLFLNTGNFKGPVTFFLPYFWSRPSVDKPNLNGLFLDSLPSEPNKAVQMETQHIPAYLARDAKGTHYVRVSPVQFPGSKDGERPMVHRITAYKKAALWDKVQSWFEGGPEATGLVDASASATHKFPGKGGATWQIWPPKNSEIKKVPIPFASFGTPTALDETTFGYKWTSSNLASSESLVTLPEYFRLDKDDKGKERWVAVSAQDVPEETGLSRVEFPRRKATDRRAYVTPTEAESSWKKPGPKAGPFEVKLGDGSLVTYSWYRFADQPALLNMDLSAEEREVMQKRVELLHRKWTKDREYLPPPATGTLASLDPAVLVTPPPGLEIGYVPIVTRQGPSDQP
ncbi:MAG: sialate O-acetylesterase [Gemmataceae bacterium]